MASTCVTDTRFLPKRVSKKSVCNPEQRRRVQGSGDRALLPGGRRFFDYAQNHYGLGKAAQGDENNGSSVVKPGGGFETRHYGSAYFHCNDMGGALRMTVAPPGITMALLRPHEVMKLVHCLLLGSCTCRAYPPPPTTPWVPAFAGTTSAGAVSLAGYFHSSDNFCLLRTALFGHPPGPGSSRIRPDRARGRLRRRTRRVLPARGPSRRCRRNSSTRRTPRLAGRRTWCGRTRGRWSRRSCSW